MILSPFLSLAQNVFGNASVAGCWGLTDCRLLPATPLPSLPLQLPSRLPLAHHQELKVPFLPPRMRGEEEELSADKTGKLPWLYAVNQ